MRKSIKRMLVLMAILGVLSSVFAMNVSAEANVQLGDINKDGSLSLRDALSVLRAAAKLESLSEDNNIIGDVDLDKEISAKDAILIFKKSLGIIWYYPGEKVEASGKIYIAGDSIAAEHDLDETYQRPLVGWGVVIGDLFDESVTVINEARSGRSSSSYIRESNYNTYINNLAKGDYYLISFGHNDEKADIYTDPHGATDEMGSFKWYLKNYYIDPAVKAGAYPVLISSVVRCNFDGNTLEKQSHTPYAIAMEELVAEYKEQGIDVGYIDLHQLTTDYYNKVGAEEAESLHAYTTTGLDRTHYCDKGAKLVSQMIADSMKEQGFDICRFMKSE